MLLQFNKFMIATLLEDAFGCGRLVASPVPRHVAGSDGFSLRVKDRS
jgi:hypothetical protein